MNPWLILVAVLAIIGAFFYGEHKGARDENVRWKAKTYHELAESSEAARKQETMWQGVVNDTVKNYQGNVAGIRRNLDLALDGLRERPSRAPSGTSEDARAACASVGGATGAELSRPDAEFLVREAARGDEIRAGLGACYEVIDAVRKK